MSGSHPAPERIDAYLLGDLSGAELEEVVAHLQGCAACREATATLAATLAAYREAVPNPADEAAIERLLATPRPRSRWAASAMAAAAAAVIFMGGFWAGHSDATRAASTAVPAVPAVAPGLIRHQSDRNPPAVAFAVADADLLGGLALRDTTWN